MFPVFMAVGYLQFTAVVRQLFNRCLETEDYCSIFLFLHGLYHIPLYPCDLLDCGDRYIEAQECAYPCCGTLTYPCPGIPEWNLLAECPCSFLASVAMVFYRQILPRPCIDRHVTQPHAQAAQDMYMTIE